MTERPEITREFLMHTAQSHLARYPCSSTHLEQVMKRKINRWIAAHGGSHTSAVRLLREVIETLQRLGYLDDERYARSKVTSLVRKGVSRHAIYARLNERGVPSELIERALDQVQQEHGSDPDFRAACAYIRRRRLGPYRRSRDQEESQRNKDLARLARAGFTYDVASRALEMESVEEIDAVLGERGDS